MRIFIVFIGLVVGVTAFSLNVLNIMKDHLGVDTETLLLSTGDTIGNTAIGATKQIETFTDSIAKYWTEPQIIKENDLPEWNKHSESIGREYSRLELLVTQIGLGFFITFASYLFSRLAKR